MSNQLIEKTATKLRMNRHGLSMWCSVTLSDLDQIIIEVKEEEYDYSQHKFVLKGLKKVRLEEMSYDLSKDNTEFRLEAITVRGFRKDGGLRARTESFYEITAGIISQIPDHYHDKAREYFFEATQELSKNLQKVIDNDLKVIVKTRGY